MNLESYYFKMYSSWLLFPFTYLFLKLYLYLAWIFVYCSVNFNQRVSVYNSVRTKSIRKKTRFRGPPSNFYVYAFACVSVRCSTVTATLCVCRARCSSPTLPWETYRTGLGSKGFNCKDFTPVIYCGTFISTTNSRPYMCLCCFKCST